MSTEERIAKALSTELGYEDHGIFTAIVRLDYGGSGQGAGLYALKGDKGIEFVRRMVDAFGVQSWEQIPGRTVIAVADYTKVHGIKPLPTEPGTAFMFDDLWNEVTA
ncbi:unannotated protein [freshwater metagenome]|uniref:Unannotated protein n=1 Tax=freshwater metagenome TaxID=449393 RepID=A0A6J7FMP0_9ZZZZ|nr:hypothetical protein [Actinomycetota bacterium]